MFFAHLCCSAGAWKHWHMLCNLLLPLAWTSLYAHPASQWHLERRGLPPFVHNPVLWMFLEGVLIYSGPAIAIHLLAVQSDNIKSYWAEATHNAWKSSRSISYVSNSMCNFALLTALCFKLVACIALPDLVFVTRCLERVLLWLPRLLTRVYSFPHVMLHWLSTEFDCRLHMACMQVTAACFISCHTRKRCPTLALLSQLPWCCRSTGALIAAIFIIHLKHELRQVLRKWFPTFSTCAMRDFVDRNTKYVKRAATLMLSPSDVALRPVRNYSAT